MCMTQQGDLSHCVVWPGGQVAQIHPSQNTATKGSKRGQEGMTNEAIFQFRYFLA